MPYCRVALRLVVGLVVVLGQACAPQTPASRCYSSNVIAVSSCDGSGGFRTRRLLCTQPPLRCIWDVQQHVHTPFARSEAGSDCWIQRQHCSRSRQGQATARHQRIQCHCVHSMHYSRSWLANGTSDTSCRARLLHHEVACSTTACQEAGYSPTTFIILPSAGGCLLAHCTVRHSHLVPHIAASAGATD